MAVIRCPNCGKPNPDFLEVCQYCEAPLHGGPAPEGTPRAADETLVPPSRRASAPEGPPGSAGAQESSLAPTGEPASSGLAPSQAGDVAAASPSPAVEPETEAEPLGWLEKLRAKHAGESEPAARTGPAVEPDWMWTGQPGDQPTAPGAQTDAGRGTEDPMARLPVWLRGLDLKDEPPAPAPIDAATQVGTRPFAGAKPGEPSTPPASTPVPGDVISPRPRKKMTDRLKGLGSSPPAGQEPPPAAPAMRNTDADLPDWLKAITSATAPAARGAEPATPVEPPPAAPGPEPAKLVEPPPSAPDESREAVIPQPSSLPPSPAEEALPLRPRRKMTDWLNALQSVPPAAPPAAPEQPAPPNADADLPPWLKAISALPTGSKPLSAPAAEVPAGAPLASSGTSSAPPASSGTSSAPPASSGTSSAPPASSGTTSAPPASGGTTSAPPASGGTTSAPPASGGTTSAPPASGGTTSAPPASGGTTSAPPASGGTSSAPLASGGTSSAPAGSKPLTSPTAGSPAGAQATGYTPVGPAPQPISPSATGGRQPAAQPGTAFQPAAPQTAAPQAAAPTPEDELPAWLKALRAQSALPARPVPGTIAPQSTTGVAAGNLAAGQRVQELPQGMRPKSETPAEPSRLSGVIQQASSTKPPGAAPAPEPLPDDMPQWLRGILSAPAQPAAAEAPAAPPGRAPLNELLRPTSPLGSRTAPAPPSPPAPAATESASSSAPSGGPAPSAAASGTPAADDTLLPASRRPRRMTDWLGSAPIPPAAPNPAEDDLPEWLRKLSLPQAGPPPSAPAAKIDLPDWFDTIAPAPSAPGATTPPTAGTVSEPAASGTGALPAPAEDLPDWIKMIAPSAAKPAAPPPAASTGPLPAAAEDVPDWLKALAPGAVTPARPAAPPPTASTGPLPAAAEDVPDWLKAMAPSAVKPATPAAPPPTAAGTGPLPAAAEDVPDWLKAMAPSAVKPATPAAPPTAAGTGPLPAAAEDVPDWMKSLAPSAEAPAAPATPPEPDSGEAVSLQPSALPSAPADELPDWMKSIAPSAEAPAAPATPPEPDSGGAVSLQPSAFPSAPADELPDWMKSMAPSADAPAAPATAAPPVTDTGQPPAPAEELPDWLKSIAPSAEAPAVPAAPAQQDSSFILHPSSLPAAPPDELPDWLKAIAKDSSSAAATAAAAESPTAGPAEPWSVEGWSASAWSAGDAQAAPEALPADTVPAAGHDQDVSDWLNSLPAAPEATTGQAGADQLPAWMQGPSAGQQPELDAETLAWLGSAQGAGPGGEAGTPAGEHAAGVEAAGVDAAGSMTTAAAPNWMSELVAASSSVAAPAPGAPAAPITADVPASGAPPAGIAPTAEEDLPEWLRTMRGESALDEPSPDEMPDWLRALRGLPPRAKAPDTAPAAADTTLVRAPGTVPAAPAPANLEQAALPAWLAAMRPVDIQRPEASEADSYQETLGVLAGMRGVLRAEPAVAQPHKATTPVHMLDVSDTHTAHANLLLELLHDAATLLPARRSAVRLSAMVERWVVFAILALAILLAQFRFASLFPLPVPGSGDTAGAGPAFAIVNGLAPGKPALVAFDYEAAQQGELNPGAMALLSHLLRRGVPVVAVSTRLTGAAAGQALLDQSAVAGSPAGYGKQYLNLGYIPGGPVGLLQFAAAPRSLFADDFTRMFTTTSVWDSAPLVNVSKLADFGLIVLVSGTPESTRMWIEQAQSFAPAVPMLAVVSASAEPLVRPYLDSAGAPQGAALRGLVVGVAGAAQYEQLAGTPGAGAALWPALGGGLLAAALLIAVGNLVFVLLAALRGVRSAQRQPKA